MLQKIGNDVYEKDNNTYLWLERYKWHQNISFNEDELLID